MTSTTLTRPATVSKRGMESSAPAGPLPSPPQLFAYRRLRRADENVRRHDHAEAVDQLAASIRAHGLLQNLIGYEQRIPGRGDPVICIVGGGRRLAALSELEEEGLLGDDWPVPVLIRAKDDAVELSLAENIEQKTMSPVDEFFAFKQLIATGRYDAAELAKRFGFTEKRVRQRLRLAELHPAILDALALRQITLDAAMAYATSSDQDLQDEVFRVHSRAGAWEAHRPERVRRDLQSKGRDTGDRLYRFIGAERYEAAGGGYEDDLFGGETARGERQLTRSYLLEQLAHDRLDQLEPALLRELNAREDLAPTLTGLVRAPGLIMNTWGTNAAIAAPEGYATTHRGEWLAEEVWRNIRRKGLAAQVAIGVDEQGKPIACAQYAFVEKGQLGAVDPHAEKRAASARAAPAAKAAQADAPPRAPAPAPYRGPTSLEVAEQARRAGVERWQRRLAVGRFAGTPFEGRAFWGSDFAQLDELNGEKGRLVEVLIFTSDAAIAAQAGLAEAAYTAAREAALTDHADDQDRELAV